MSKKVILGLSGGVDSAVTAALVSKTNQAAGITLKLYDGDNPDLISKFDQEAKDAADVCKKLGISHTTLDLKSDFYNYVIKHFIDEYIAGRTPNPCIQCNIHIKFLLLINQESNLSITEGVIYSLIFVEQLSQFSRRHIAYIIHCILR